ncbi:MAG TPA: TMEM175 family protein [Pyrinomonadaceae bacterium]|nr:TMEM175 family protein [Pyrinomonadaceae bacterium]
MIRETLSKREAEVQNGFRLRGLGEVSRVEALSDGVIAFAITLLVVSLEVPHTFDELLVTMRGFLAFAITFAMLFHVWLVQYKFFRRYGMSDNFTIWLTALLLFVVLFYVYPLKFVWTLIVNAFIGVGTSVKTAAGQAEPVVRAEQIPTMLLVYGLGFAAVFAIFALLYMHAYRKRGELNLNELEAFDTRTWFQENALMSLVGLFSVAVALTRTHRYMFLSGMSYWLIAPVLFAHGHMRGRRRRALERRAEEVRAQSLAVDTESTGVLVADD